MVRWKWRMKWKQKQNGQFHRACVIIKMIVISGIIMLIVWCSCACGSFTGLMTLFASICIVSARLRRSELARSITSVAFFQQFFFILCQFSDDRLKSHIPWNCVSSLLLFSLARLITCGGKQHVYMQMINKGSVYIHSWLKIGNKARAHTVIEIYQRGLRVHTALHICQKKMQLYISAFCPHIQF